MKTKVHPVSEVAVSNLRESELGITGMRRNTSSGSLSDDGSSMCSIPDMDAIDQMDQPPMNDFFENNINRDKIAITRFVNAGIFSALICGVQKRLGSRR